MLQIKSVDYLSPHELRNDLEVILGMHGRKGLSKQNIKTNYPVLFYNLVWYCTRMKMNFPLFEMESERNCESNEKNDFSNVMNEIEEQVLLGPHEAWARDTINKRRAFVAEKGKMVLQANKTRKNMSFLQLPNEEWNTTDPVYVEYQNQ